MNGALHYGMAAVIIIVLVGSGYLADRWTMKNKMNPLAMKMLLGFDLVFLLVALAAVIALGDIDPQKSPGLDTIIGALITIIAGFTGWAYKHDKSD